MLGSNFDVDSTPVDSKEELLKEVEAFLDNIGLCQNKKNGSGIKYSAFLH